MMKSIQTLWYVIPAIASEYASEYIHHTREAGSRLRWWRCSTNLPYRVDPIWMTDGTWSGYWGCRVLPTGAPCSESWVLLEKVAVCTKDTFENQERSR